MHYISVCIMKTFNDDIQLFLLFSGVGFGTDSSIEGTLESELGQVQSNYLEGKHPLHPWFICQQ
jgi:hypothetical protein